MYRQAAVPLLWMLLAGPGHHAALAAEGDALGRTESSPMIMIPRLSTTGGAEAASHDPPWSKAARLGGFLEVDGGAMAPASTWVELAYDSETLWVRFRCESAGAAPLKAEVTERDGPVWRDDSVEMLIRPPGERSSLYHFIVNAQGVRFDAEVLDKSWDATWTAETSIDADGWSAVMAIPFAAFKPVPPPRAGDVWRMNFCRNSPSGEASHRSIWSPTIGSLQSPQYYGQVEFGDASIPPVRFMEMAPVGMGASRFRVQAGPGVSYELTGIGRTGSAHRLGGGKLSADGAITCRIDDDEIRGVRLSLTGEDGRQLAAASYPMESPAISATLTELKAQLAEIRAMLDRLPDAARRKASDVVAEVLPLLADADAVFNHADRRTAENWARLAPIVSRMKRVLDGPAGYARTLARFPRADFAVGLANSMQKIMIQGHPFEGWYDDHYDLKLARYEHEGFQVVIMPYHQDLRNASVSLAPLVHASGEPFRGKTAVSLVGHVDVIDNTRYKVDHHGWWPDPLLSFQTQCDVRAGDHVAFWIDVAASADTRPGEYTGRVVVSAEGCDPIELILNVRVWDFQLAAGTHLRNAFTYNEGPVGHFYRDRWDESMRRKYHDLILDHRLNVDHLYRRTPPPIELLEYARTRGLNAFNVGGVFRGDPKGDAARELRGYISALKQKGLFPFAYVYGYDEVKPEKFAELRTVFGGVHERYPGLETMTTAIDHSYGKESGLREVVDIWVPLTDWYDLDEARQLRAEGKRVWWYICVVPEHPYANWFIEYPAIEARLLMGAMSYKYEVDGFLYYMINLWTGNHRPIESGPYTQWNPGSLVNEKKHYTANGDGSLICPGPDGPLSTIRLENIRDGLEDYEYLYLLAERVRAIRKLPANPERTAYLKEAGELLAVPASLVRNLVEYSREPEQLSGFRDRVALAILQGDRLLAGGE